ncbi:MAG: O-antigen ligase family protein [Planctomycetota bacterium]
MTFAAALLLVFAHSQDLYPIAAVLSVIVFVCACIGRYPMLSALRSLDVVLAIVLAVFSVVIAWLQCGDLVSENPVGYFASDGRATYMFLFYIAVRFALASRPEAVDELLSAGILVASGIALISLLTFVAGPITVGDQYVGSMPTAGGRVAVGLLGTKNSFAGNNTAALVLAFSLWAMRPRLRVMSRPFLMLCMTCLAVGSMISGSRGYLLGCLAGFGLVILCFRSEGRPSKRHVAGGLLLGMVCVGVLSATFVAVNSERMEELSKGNDTNVVRRFQLFGYATSLWSKSMLVGVGPGSIMQPNLALRESNAPWYSERLGGSKPDYGDWTWVGDLPLGQHAHNQLLQFLADYGVFGLGMLIAVLSAGIRGGVLRGFSPFDDQELGRRRLAITSLLFVAVAGSSAGYTLTSASIAWSTWVLVAACRSEDNWYEDDDHFEDDDAENEDDFEGDDPFDHDDEWHHGERYW